MIQLSFADLKGLPSVVGKYFLVNPLPGTQAYKDEQALRQWQQWQSHVPGMLVRDGWILDQTWHEGQWRWEIRHLHTSLVTMPVSSLHDAIDQALWLATFYELLPLQELLQISAMHPNWLCALPTFYHRYQYEPATAKRWYGEYLARVMKNR
jgi:hypothetical protein